MRPIPWLGVVILATWIYLAVTDYRDDQATLLSDGRDRLARFATTLNQHSDHQLQSVTTLLGIFLAGERNGTPSTADPSWIRQPEWSTFFNQTLVPEGAEALRIYLDGPEPVLQLGTPGLAMASLPAVETLVTQVRNQGSALASLRDHAPSGPAFQVAVPFFQQGVAEGVVWVHGSILPAVERTGQSTGMEWAVAPKPHPGSAGIPVAASKNFFASALAMIPGSPEPGGSLVETEGRFLILGQLPLRDGRGEGVGVVFGATDLTEQTQLLHNRLTNHLLLIAVLIFWAWSVATRRTTCAGQFTLMIAMILIFFGAITLFLSYVNFDKNYALLVKSRMEVIVKEIKNSVELGLNLGLNLEEFKNVQKILLDVRKLHPDIRMLAVLDDRGRMLYSEPQKVDKDRVAGALGKPGLKERDPLMAWEVAFDHGDPGMVGIGMPLVNNFQQNVGAVILQVDDSHNETVLKNVRFRLWILYVSSVLLFSWLSIPLVWFNSRFLLRELQDLEIRLDLVAEGRHPSPGGEEHASELGSMVSTLGQVYDRLAVRFDQIATALPVESLPDQAARSAPPGDWLSRQGAANLGAER